MTEYDDIVGLAQGAEIEKRFQRAYTKHFLCFKSQVKRSKVSAAELTSVCRKAEACLSGKLVAAGRETCREQCAEHL